MVLVISIVGGEFDVDRLIAEDAFIRSVTNAIGLLVFVGIVTLLVMMVLLLFSRPEADVVDVLVVDVANGHSKIALDATELLKE